MKSELLKIAEAIVSQSVDGEQVEVVAVHGTETDIRVYQGDIESFTAAESQGVGIRVVQDGRQGMAYAGSLDVDVLNETLEEARDNASFGTPDEFQGIAEPDGIESVPLELLDSSLADFANEEIRLKHLGLLKYSCGLLGPHHQLRLQ